MNIHRCPRGLSVPGVSRRAGFIARALVIFCALAVGLHGLGGVTTAADAPTPGAPDKQAKLAALKTEMDEVIQKVTVIVNQPVAAVRRTAAMKVSLFQPGWFHEGATKPDFNSVDVRQTQETGAYDSSPYVTSNLNPGLAWVGRQLEFNPMTKYFYTNRALPKKRLSDVEMVEINRLYRIIGKCEQQKADLARSEIADRPAESGEPWTLQPIPRARYIQAGIALAVVLGLYFLVRKFR